MTATSPTCDAGPAIVIAGMNIYTDREGDRVTGRVEFPDAYRREPVSIDYRSTQPAKTAPPASTTLDPKAQKRLDIVDHYKRLCREQPEHSKATHLRRLSIQYGCRPRSIQNWTRKAETEGTAGLCDRYTGPAPRVLDCSPEKAADAERICAWWCLRIANCQSIDTPMITSAVALLAHASVADVFATIDCYFSYDCDRTARPFKRFDKWAKYDFAKWLLRACESADYRRALQTSQDDAVPLRRPESRNADTVPPPKVRQRAVNSRPTRDAIRRLAPANTSPLTKGGKRGVDTNGVAANAKRLRALGLHSAARDLVLSKADGPAALALNESPITLAQALATLRDNYRRMLLKASRGDREARRTAIATFALWWQQMPQSIRNNIDFKVDAWSKSHPRATPRQATARRTDMLLAELRRKPQLSTLNLAGRLPQ